MSGAAPFVRSLLGAAALSLTIHTAARAQAAAAKPRYPIVCAKGVRIYTDRAQLPAKRDSLTMPPAPGPVRVSSPEEAEAAELAMRERAGSVGATSILIADETSEEGGGTRVQRRVSAYFVPSDSARAQQTCGK